MTGEYFLKSNSLLMFSSWWIDFQWLWHQTIHWYERTLTRNHVWIFSLSLHFDECVISRLHFTVFDIQIETWVISAWYDIWIWLWSFVGVEFSLALPFKSIWNDFFCFLPLASHVQHHHKQHIFNPVYWKHRIGNNNPYHCLKPIITYSNASAIL